MEKARVCVCVIKRRRQYIIIEPRHLRFLRRVIQNHFLSCCYRNIENKWTISPRAIFTCNAGAFPDLPVTNLSLACNHCKKAVCLDGCPSGSYYREAVTGAVVIDESKCIGCRYCQWNCPYDAPKYDQVKHVMGKCNLCYSRLTEGLLPACTTACPTGALKYGELSETDVKNIPVWFPDKNLKPGIEFTGAVNNKPLRILPAPVFENNKVQTTEYDSGRSGEWSLISFSFLITISVAIMIASLIDGFFPGRTLSISIVFAAGIASLFHLGKISGAYKAVTNLKSSPLSREIAFFILYSLVTVITVVLQLPLLLIISTVAGLLMLVAADGVYLYSDKRKNVILHSGQTFISALLVASFLTGMILPFLFTATVKLILSLRSLIINRKEKIFFGIRYLRIAMLLTASISLVSKIAYPGIAIMSLFLAGELLDRIIFYIDFKPLNINRLIDQNIIIAKDEKKRG